MCNVLVFREDRVLLNKGFAHANVRWNVANTPEAHFWLESVRKQFTAALVLLLEQQDKLDIDDPRTRYLHDLPNAWKQVTLSKLLDHSSGVPHLTSPRNFRS